jgi:uncharacterized protein YbjT (DUF2867 family)
MPGLNILLVGGSGSVGREVRRAAVAAGHRVRILTRRPPGTDAHAEVAIADLTDPATLSAAVEAIDAVVFTHGTHSSSPAELEAVEYGGVRNILAALSARDEQRPVRVALMTSIGVTNRQMSGYTPDWKRRSERLVRASGHAYTIVRPGWFDYNDSDQHRLHFLQGDRRWNASPADGVIARSQIADVLVASLESDAADHKTLELVAERGPAQTDLDPLFAELDVDIDLDGPADTPNLPLDAEPDRIKTDIAALRPAH